MTSGETDRDDTSALLERCQAGDRKALKALLARDLEAIRDHAHRELRGSVRLHEQTDDVVHDVVVRILTQGPRLLLESRDRFRALMARVVTNHLRNRARDYARQKRSAKKEKRFDGESILDSGGASPHESVTGPLTGAGREEEGSLVRFAMLLLSQADQDVLHYREWEQLPFKQVAEQLGVTEDAARMRYGRAVQRLTRCVFLLRAGRVSELPTEDADEAT